MSRQSAKSPDLLLSTESSDNDKSSCPAAPPCGRDSVLHGSANLCVAVRFLPWFLHVQYDEAAVVTDSDGGWIPKLQTVHFSSVKQKLMQFL